MIMKIEKNISGFSETLIRVLCLSALLLIVSVGCSRDDESKKKSLKLYAGAGMRRGVDALVAAFEKRTAIRVDVDYGGSGMIISRAGEDPDADLFMPGDVWYVDRLQEKKGVIASKSAVAYFVPVILVQKGNPEKINTLKDFFRPGIRVALGNPDACQIGRTTKKIFTKAGLDTGKLHPKESLTVNELGVWVKMHDADAAVVWDAIAANIAKDTDIIEIPESQNIISRVVIALMTTSHNKKSAQKFIDFLLSEEGREILKAHKYRIDKPYE